MRIVSKLFTDTWKNKCLNVHPSLLPEFAKGMDMDVHSAVLQSGKKFSCTVHYVTEELDGGPILCQEKCDVNTDDTAESLLKKRFKHWKEKLLSFLLINILV